MSADLQFKQLVDRILRCREAEDAAKADTKEVYAEIKGLGYDKTAAGALVNELRKREKNPDKFEEASTVLDLYRDAYQRASGGTAVPHAHTREAVAEFQPARMASIAEQRSAFREGAPISQDFTYENASVYFIAFHGISRVKIGLSNDVERRIADLEKACGDVAEILAVIPGNRRAETAALRHHAEWCISGEWFDLCDELIASIKVYADELAATHTHEAHRIPAQDSGGTATGESPSDKSKAGQRASERTLADADLNDGTPAGQTGIEVVTGGESAATDFEPPAFLTKERKPLRPSCLNPSECAGYGRITCHRCKVAAGHEEEAAA